MRLTGLPLIATSALLTVVVLAATILLWSRFGRWRLLTRALGVVLAQALVVATVGLIANRSEEFYPSWQALRGDTGTTESTAPPPSGRLDATLTAGETTVPWHPAELASWKLAATPTVVLPVTYRDRPATTFPVVLALTANAAEATAAARVRADGAITLVVTPTAATKVAALEEMATTLGGDVRVSGYGWGLVASARESALAAQLADATPGRFAGEAVIGSGARPQGEVAFALVLAVAGAKPAPSGKTPEPGKSSPSCPAAAPGKSSPACKAGSSGGAATPGKVNPSGRTVRPGRSSPSGKTPEPGKSPAAGKGKSSGNRAPSGQTPASPQVPAPGNPAPPAPPTVLTCKPDAVWKVALRWATEQTSQPLQPAVRLPAGARSVGAPPAKGLAAGKLPSGKVPPGKLPPGRHPGKGSPANGSPANGSPANGDPAGGGPANGKHPTTSPSAPGHPLGGHPAAGTVFPAGAAATARSAGV